MRTSARFVWRRRAVVLAALVAASAVVVLGFASVASTSTAKTWQIAFIGQGYPNPHTKAEANGAIARAKQVGAHITVFDPAFDAVKQVSQFQDALTSGKYDAYLINCLDCSAIIPTVKKAIAEGKKIVTIASPLSGTSATTGYYPGTVAHINVTPVAQGKIMAREVIKALPSGGNMALIEGIAGQTGNEDFKKGFMSIMKTQSKIKIVADQYAQWDPTKATTVLQAILQAHPNQINLLLTWADEMTAGPVQLLQAQHLLCTWPATSCTGKIKVIGHDMAKGGYDALKKGWFVSDWANIPYQHGYIGVDYLVKALKGIKVPHFNPAHPSPPCAKTGDCIFTPASVKGVKGLGY
jgi:ABC-type sugar transport system substrate-binding protein